MPLRRTVLTCFCYDLRHTAISLMREVGIPVELAAARLGHGDGGALLLRQIQALDAACAQKGVSPSRVLPTPRSERRTAATAGG